MWQGSLKLNPSPLIGSFLVGISRDGLFPCETVISFVFFLFESRQIQNLQLKLRKRKRVKILILSKEITQKTYILQSFQQGRERQNSPSESQFDNFIIPAEDQEASDGRN